MWWNTYRKKYDGEREGCNQQRSLRTRMHALRPQGRLTVICGWSLKAHCLSTANVLWCYYLETTNWTGQNIFCNDCVSKIYWVFNLTMFMLHKIFLVCTVQFNKIWILIYCWGWSFIYDVFNESPFNLLIIFLCRWKTCRIAPSSLTCTTTAWKIRRFSIKKFSLVSRWFTFQPKSTLEVGFFLNRLLWTTIYLCTNMSVGVYHCDSKFEREDINNS